uniref:Uncharacterized protein n=1 Tax=Arundo donax TaxID=35708 RepID=A0A0A8YCD7_ARUDO
MFTIYNLFYLKYHISIETTSRSVTLDTMSMS